MSRHRSSRGGSTPSLPPVPRWVRNLLIGAFALYVTELVLRNFGAPVELLMWHPWSYGFEIWQPLTRFAIQGGEPTMVLLGLVVAYFLLPALEQLFAREVLGQAIAAAAVGGTLLAGVAEFSGVVAPAMITGWPSLMAALVVLFGLARPQGLIYLFFVLPLPGWLLVWGTLVIDLLYLLANPSTATVEPIGIWLGTLGWWNYMGPGARRRHLKRQARKIEADLQKFQVLEGGRSGPQGEQDPDDWIH